MQQCIYTRSKPFEIFNALFRYKYLIVFCVIRGFRFFTASSFDVRKEIIKKCLNNILSVTYGNNIAQIVCVYAHTHTPAHNWRTNWLFVLDCDNVN